MPNGTLPAANRAQQEYASVRQFVQGYLDRDRQSAKDALQVIGVYVAVAHGIPALRRLRRSR